MSREWDLITASMMESWGAFARITPGGRAVERDGLVASVVPTVPERSVMNSVIYADPAALEASLEELAAEYEDAGVLAWTVWVPEHDRASAELLAEAGHALDATPVGMICTPGDVDRPDPAALDLEPDPTFAQVADLNDLAYGYSEQPFRRALGKAPTDGSHLYVARVDSEPAACVVAADHAGGDCGVYWVATAREARGRGLATALMRLAVADAHERGRTTSTLQATKLGQPVYERVGYRSIGTLEMWERRRPG
ncbi:MAG TPA: GNAT family N-acetyltransferase [Thermoleophilaceae bacterium]|nr:GNAT family N-acetyltransferase [Thermoleophilaceae bacterium]